MRVRTGRFEKLRLTLCSSIQGAGVGFQLPPSIAFMLDEFRGNQLALADVSRRLSDKIFVRDYFDQCCASIGTFKYANDLEARPDKFHVYAGSGLNPLSFGGKCPELQCVIDSAHYFAWTACLYADRVVIPAPFSFTYIEATDEEIFLSLAVLKILKPLVEAGIVPRPRRRLSELGGCVSLTRAIKPSAGTNVVLHGSAGTPPVLVDQVQDAHSSSVDCMRS
jgi:hypothetical protein